MAHLGARRSVGRRLAVTALALGMSTAAMACSAGSATKSVSLKSPTGSPGEPTPTAASGIGSAGGDVVASSGARAGGDAQPATGPATTTANTTGPVGATASTRTGGPTATTPQAPTGPRVTSPGASGPTPAAPGTYYYKLVNGQTIVTTGTTPRTLAVAPQTTLVISASGSTEQWVNSTASTNMAFTGSGVFLLSEAVPLAATTCAFDAPVAFPPWPLAVGRSFSGHGTCTGQLTEALSLQGQVIGAESLPLDGGTSTFTVKSTLTLVDAKLKVVLTVVELDWYAPSLRLPVQTTIGIQSGGTGYSVASAATYTLTSSRPS